MCPEPASAKFVFPCLFKQTSRVRYRFPCRLFAKCPIIFSSTRTICYMVRRETQRCCFKALFPRGHFTTSHLPGSQVSAPKFSLCLPVPFTRLLLVVLALQTKKTLVVLALQTKKTVSLQLQMQREGGQSRRVRTACLFPPLLPLPVPPQPRHPGEQGPPHRADQAIQSEANSVYGMQNK